MSTTKTMYYNGLYTLIETEVVLKGAPKQVWEVFADFSSWDKWSTGFMTFLEPPSKAGKRCGVVCKLSQGALKSTTHWPMVEVMEEAKELMWRDFSLVYSPFWHGCHWFRFEEMPNGCTRMLHGTRQMGLAMPALWNAMKSTEIGYHAFNNELAAEVARRFPEPAAAAKDAAAPAAAAAADDSAAAAFAAPQMGTASKMASAVAGLVRALSGNGNGGMLVVPPVTGVQTRSMAKRNQQLTTTTAKDPVNAERPAAIGALTTRC